MTTPALLTMLAAEGLITAATLYFFYRVLSRKPQDYRGFPDA